MQLKFLGFSGGTKKEQLAIFKKLYISTNNMQLNTPRHLQPKLEKRNSSQKYGYNQRMVPKKLIYLNSNSFLDINIHFLS